MATVTDVIDKLKSFPPDAEVKILVDIGEFDPVIVWSPLDLDKVKLVDEDVHIK